MYLSTFKTAVKFYPVIFLIQKVVALRNQKIYVYSEVSFIKLSENRNPSIMRTKGSPNRSSQYFLHL